MKHLKDFIKKIKNIGSFMSKKWDNFINLKIVSFIFKFLPHNPLILLLFFAVLFLNYQYMTADKQRVIYQRGEPLSTVGPIITDEIIIPLEGSKVNDKASKVCIRFATYAHKTRSDYRYRIYNKENLIYEEKFNSNILNDGEFGCFDLKNIDLKNIDDYSISISPIYTDIDNVVTIYTDLDGTANIRFVQETRYLSYDNIICGGFIIIFILFCFFINKQNKDNIGIEKYWIALVIFFYIPLTIINPPYEVPDEPRHFVSALYNSQIVEKSKEKDNDVKLPKSYECLNYANIQTIDKISDFNEVKKCINESDNVKANLFYTHGEYVSSFTSYIPSSLGIKTFDIFSNSPLIIFMGGRLFNLLFASILIYFALKISPRYKELIFTAASMPMFVQAICSYNYDCVVFSSITLIFAIIIKLIYEEKINKQWLYLLLLLPLGIFIAGAKYIYLSVLMLFLCIPSDRFKKKWYKYVYLALIIIMSYIIASLINNTISINEIIVKDPVDNMVNEKINLIKNPVYFSKLVFNTFKINGIFYLNGFVGYFGWFKIKMNDLFIYVYAILFAGIIYNNGRKKIKLIHLVIIIISLLLTFAGIFAAMYFSWSSIDLKYIDGVQGRYFIPLLLPVIYLIFSSKKKSVNSVNYEKSIIQFGVLMVLNYIMMLLIMYY